MSLKKVYINDLPLNIVYESELGYAGLKFRLNLPSDSCALFPRKEEGYHYFWMQDVLIPLDIIFINKDGEIVEIAHSARPMDQTPITSLAPASIIVEVNGGWCLANKVSIGDKVVVR